MSFNTPTGRYAMQRRQIERLLAEADDSDWIPSTFLRPDGSEIQTVDDVMESIDLSVRASPVAELYGVVSAELDGPVICYTGNGPKRAANAALLSSARTLAQLCLRLIEENDLLR
jgi:hypothetical protein